MSVKSSRMRLSVGSSHSRTEASTEARARIEFAQGGGDAVLPGNAHFQRQQAGDRTRKRCAARARIVRGMGVHGSPQGSDELLEAQVGQLCGSRPVDPGVEIDAAVGFGGGSGEGNHQSLLAFHAAIWFFRKASVDCEAETLLSTPAKRVCSRARSASCFSAMSA